MAMSPALEQWKARLRADGTAALRAILNGTASLGQMSAAEPEDAIDAILASEEQGSDLVDHFDQACSDLLEEYRSTLLEQKDRAFRIELSRFTSFIAMIRRILPKQTIIRLHREYIIWNGFFENFVVDRGLDLRREYFRILALSQDLAAEGGLQARRLMPLWLSICAESGEFGRYDPSYLRVALMGLRRLPLGDAFDANEDFALQGLARWAVTQRPLEPAFEREWRILEGDFPRSYDFWQDRVQAAIVAAETELSERTHQAETSFPIADWWRKDVDIDPRDRTSRGGAAKEPPPREEREAILRDIGNALESLRPRINTLMTKHRHYADKTGDVFYLVRTACNIGMNLLRKGLPSEKASRGIDAASLAKLALDYFAEHIAAWSLLRDALAASGRIADAELVGWEAIRRFPEDVQFRTQLATVLVTYAGKTEEAAALLGETTALFPLDPFARTQLATLLATRMGKAEKAMALLLDTKALFPTDAYVRTQLATVLADDLRRTADARAVLEGAIADGLDDNTIQSLLHKLDQGRTLRRKASPRAAIPDTSHLNLATAIARRQLFLFEARISSTAELHAVLNQLPKDSYTTYVSQRAGLSDMPFKTNFALAFDAALQLAEPSALRALVASVRPMERAIVEKAVALSEGRVVLFRDVFAEGARNERAQRLEETLAQSGGREDRQTVLLRDFVASTLVTSLASLQAA